MSDKEDKPDTTLYGVSQIPNNGDIPASQTRLRVGRHDLKQTLAEAAAVPEELRSPAMQLALLHAHELFKRAAIATLRATVNGDMPRLTLCRPDGVELPTAEELADYAGVEPLVEVSKEDMAQYADDTSHTVYARLRELQALAGDMADEGVCDMLQSLGQAFDAIGQDDLQSACGHITDLQFGMAQVLHALQSQQPSTAYNALHGKEDIRKMLAESLQEAMQAKLTHRLGSIESADEQLAFVQKVRGMFEMFFGQEPDRSMQI